MGALPSECIPDATADYLCAAGDESAVLLSPRKLLLLCVPANIYAIRRELQEGCEMKEAMA